MTSVLSLEDGGLRPWSEHLPVGMSAEGLDVVRGRSLTTTWLDQWACDPTHVVLTDASGTSLTAQELEGRSAGAAQRMAAAGVEPGDHVVVSAGPSLDFVIAYVGILRLGAVVVPLNKAYRAQEVMRIVGDARPTAVVTDDADRAAWISRAAPDAIISDPDLRGLPASSGMSVTLDAADSRDSALLVYTSGTTGAPKGAPLSHANLLASAEAVRLAWRWEPDDRLVLALPLFHLHGLGVGLHGTFTAGASVVLHERFDAAAVLDAVRTGGTLFFGVPTMWHRLANAPDAAALARLRLGVSGSAPLPSDLHAAVASVAGRPPLERYGMTETALMVSNPYEGERRPGSVGFPLPGVDVCLAAGDGPADAASEILVRGPNVFDGYWQDREATAAAFTDGWFRTGDLGVVDPDGYLRIAGRAKELIITGGYNVHPHEVEEVLRTHPAVADAAVVGVPDTEWGELVCAFLVEADPVADGVVAAWCADKLAPYKHPRRWVRVDEIPRNALGKTMRDLLLRQFQSKYGGS